MKKKQITSKGKLVFDKAKITSLNTVMQQQIKGGWQYAAPVKELQAEGLCRAFRYPPPPFI